MSLLLPFAIFLPSSTICLSVDSAHFLWRVRALDQFNPVFLVVNHMYLFFFGSSDPYFLSL